MSAQALVAAEREVKLIKMGGRLVRQWIFQLSAFRTGATTLQWVIVPMGTKKRSPSLKTPNMRGNSGTLAESPKSSA